MAHAHGHAPMDIEAILRPFLPIEAKVRGIPVFLFEGQYMDTVRQRLMFPVAFHCHDLFVGFYVWVYHLAQHPLFIVAQRIEGITSKGFPVQMAPECQGHLETALAPLFAADLGIAWPTAVSKEVIDRDDSKCEEEETPRKEAEAARKEAEAARKEVEAARKEAEAVRTEAEAVRTEAETARTEAETARCEAEAARTEADTVRKELSVLTEQCADLRRAAARSEERAAAAEAAVAQRKEVTSAAQAALTASEEKRKGAEEACASLNRQLQKARAELAGRTTSASASEVEKLASNCRALEGRVAALIEERDDLAAQRKVLGARVSALESGSSPSRQRKEKTLSALRVELRSLRAANDNVKQKLEKSEHACSALLGEMSILRKAFDERAADREAFRETLGSVLGINERALELESKTADIDIGDMAAKRDASLMEHIDEAMACAVRSSVWSKAMADFAEAGGVLHRPGNALQVLLKLLGLLKSNGDLLASAALAAIRARIPEGICTTDYSPALYTSALAATLMSARAVFEDKILDKEDGRLASWEDAELPAGLVGRMNMAQGVHTFIRRMFVTHRAKREGGRDMLSLFVRYYDADGACKLMPTYCREDTPEQNRRYQEGIFASWVAGLVAYMQCYGQETAVKKLLTVKMVLAQNAVAKEGGVIVAANRRRAVLRTTADLVGQLKSIRMVASADGVLLPTRFFERCKEQCDALLPTRMAIDDPAARFEETDTDAKNPAARPRSPPGPPPDTVEDEELASKLREEAERIEAALPHFAMLPRGTAPPSLSIPVLLADSREKAPAAVSGTASGCIAANFLEYAAARK